MGVPYGAKNCITRGNRSSYLGGIGVLKGISGGTGETTMGLETLGHGIRTS